MFLPTVVKYLIKLPLSQTTPAIRFSLHPHSSSIPYTQSWRLISFIECTGHVIQKPVNSTIIWNYNYGECRYCFSEAKLSTSSVSIPPSPIQKRISFCPHLDMPPYSTKGKLSSPTGLSQLGPRVILISIENENNLPIIPWQSARLKPLMETDLFLALAYTPVSNMPQASVFVIMVHRQVGLWST